MACADLEMAGTALIVDRAGHRPVPNGRRDAGAVCEPAGLPSGNLRSPPETVFIQTYQYVMIEIGRRRRSPQRRSGPGTVAPSRRADVPFCLNKAVIMNLTLRAWCRSSTAGKRTHRVYTTPTGAVDTFKFELEDNDL